MLVNYYMEIKGFTFLELSSKLRVIANKCQKEKIMTLKEAIQKDGQRHLPYVYVYVKSEITSGTTQ